MVLFWLGYLNLARTHLLYLPFLMAGYLVMEEELQRGPGLEGLPQTSTLVEGSCGEEKRMKHSRCRMIKFKVIFMKILATAMDVLQPLRLQVTTTGVLHLLKLLTTATHIQNQHIPTMMGKLWGLIVSLIVVHIVIEMVLITLLPTLVPPQCQYLLVVAPVQALFQLLLVAAPLLKPQELEM